MPHPRLNVTAIAICPRGYAGLSRTAARFRATEECVLDDLITEALTDAHIRCADRTGRVALRLVALVGTRGYMPIGAADASPPRDDADLRPLIETGCRASSHPPLGGGGSGGPDDLTARPTSGPDRT